MTTRRKKVLVLTHFYTPGYRGGGPIKSISNLVEILGNELDFYVVTSDRDLGSKAPYEGIRFDEWLEVGRAKVFYVGESPLWWLKIARVVSSRRFDLIYLNSFFPLSRTYIWFCKE